MVLVPELGALAIALLCLGLALIATLIVKSLISSMGGVPLIGRVIGAVLSPVAHALQWAAGQAEHGVDLILGATLHTLSKVLEWTFDYYKAQASALLQMAHIIGGQLYNVSGLRSVVTRLEKAWHGIEHGVRDLHREVTKLEHKVNVIDHEISKGIGDDVLPRLRHLEREIGHVENKVIPGIRSAADAAEADVSELAKYIADNFVTDAELVTEATVAALLTAGGLSWLRCNSNPFNGNKQACGLWSILERVLGLAAFLTVAFDFREFVAASQTVAEFIGGAVGEFEGAFPLSLEPLPPPE